jgi:hypothetical protein
MLHDIDLKVLTKRAKNRVTTMAGNVRALPPLADDATNAQKRRRAKRVQLAAAFEEFPEHYTGIILQRVLGRAEIVAMGDAFEAQLLDAVRDALSEEFNALAEQIPDPQS